MTRQRGTRSPYLEAPEVYRARAAECLAEADSAGLVNVVNAKRAAAQRWLALAERAERMDRRLDGALTQPDRALAAGRIRNRSRWNAEGAIKAT